MFKLDLEKAEEPEIKLPTSTGSLEKQVKGSEVAQLCPTVCDPMDCSLPGFSVHVIFQARVLEWVAISFSRESSQPRDLSQVSHTAVRGFTVWATRKKQESSRKTSTSALWTMPKPWTVGPQQTLEHSERDGNTRPPDLPPEKPVWWSGSNS